MNYILLFVLYLSNLIINKFNKKFTIKKQFEYINFADCVCKYNIKNYYNVVSNLIFVLGGLYHVYNDIILCILSFCVFIGSSYFHLEPTIHTLFYDRLPMQISFTYLVLTKINLHFIESFIIVFYAIYSLCKWQITLDLIPYASFQLSIILYWLFFDTSMLYPILCYIFAKICEDYDVEIYFLTHQNISGHTLKHIFAGIALFFI